MMQIWVDIATMIAACATAGALILTIVTYRGQTNAQVFIEYTRRYAAVMGAFPNAEAAARTAFKGAPPAESPALTTAILSYLNLCSEEFYMWRNGMLSTRVWSIWEAEIKSKLASPLVRREWHRLADDFAAFPEFGAFVGSAQSEARQIG